MAEVTLVQLAAELRLDPKQVRRLIRRHVPEAVAGHQRYVFDSENEVYQRILAVCRGEAGQSKRRDPSKPHKQRAFRPIDWDSRGMYTVDGQVWVTVLVPRPEEPTTRDARPVYLGKPDEVTAVLRGDQERPESATNLQQLAWDQVINAEPQEDPFDQEPKKKRKSRRG